MKKFAKKIFKIISPLVFAILLMHIALTIHAGLVYAENASTIPNAPAPEAYGLPQPIDAIRAVGDGTNLPNFYSTGQHPDAPPDYLQPGAGTVTSPIYFAIDMFKYAISGIAFIVIIIQAIKLVSRSSEEEAGKAKTGLLMGLIGLLVIQLADVFVKQMIFGEQGDAFEDLTTAKLYAEESVSVIRALIGFVEVFVGVGAVLVIVIRGFVVLTSAGEEEALTAAKKHILYAIFGLIAVGISELVVRGFVFPQQGEALPDIQSGKEIIIMLTNFVSGFVAIIAFVILLFTGYRYVMSGGEEEVNEKIKKAFIGAVIALILSLGAFAMVNTVIKLEPAQDSVESLAENP